MNTEINTKSPKTFNPSTAARKKITADIVKLSTLNVGASIVGIYKSVSEREWLNKETGAIEIITQFHFENAETGERFVVFGDSGFKNAMAAAAVEPNDWIEVQKLEQVSLSGGRRVNQYDIFQLTPQ